MNRCLTLFILIVGMLCATPVLAAEAQNQERSIVVGTELAYPPYSFRDTSGDPAGYNADLARAIAQTTQLDIEIRIGPWGEIRKALEKGEIDAIVGMFYSEERDKKVDFSPPYTVIHHSIFVRKNGPDIAREADLKDKEIIVMRGDIMHDYVLKKGLSTHPVLVETLADALRLLSSGKHDCALLAKLPGLYWLKELGLNNVATVGPVMRPSNYCFAVNDGNAVLLHRLGEGLALIGETGVHQEIFKKWLAALEPRGYPTSTVLLYIAFIAGPLLLLLGASAIWLRTLRSQVARRTAALKRSKHRLEHLNRILSAIRNVNQLITHEKDRDRLLDQACRLIVETQGYQKIWIVLVEQGRPVEPFFHKNFNGSFAPMAKRLLAGNLPHCARKALASDGVHVVIAPAMRCTDCHLAGQYEDRASLSIRLENQGRVFGWISAAVPGAYAQDKEEQSLFTEVAGDIAYALRTIEDEARHTTMGRQYTAVLTTTPDAIIAADLDGRITLFNLSAEKLFGCTAEEALGTPISRFCPQDRLEEQAEMIRRLHETGPIRFYETERLASGGRRVPVEITLGLNTDEQGHPQGINAILRDITKRKQAEETLRESEAMLQSVFTGSHDLIAITDEKARTHWANPAWQSQFGSDLEDRPDPFSLLHPEDAQRVSETWNLLVSESREIQNMAYRFKLDTGEWATFQTNAFAMTVNDRKQYCVVARDVSRQKKLEHARKEAIREKDALLKAQRAVLEMAEFADTARAIFDACAEYVGAPAGYFAIMSADRMRNEVLFLESGGLPCSVEPTLPMPIRGLRKTAYDKGRAVFENDFLSTPHAEWMPEGHVALENVLFAPLVLDNQAVGLIGLANKPGGFNDDDARVSYIFGQIAAVALREFRTRQAMQASEEKYRLAMEVTKDGLWDWDVSTGDVFYSPTWSIILGETEVKPEYASWEEKIHPDDRDDVISTLKDHLEGNNESWSQEHRLRTADGVWKWFLGRGQVVKRMENGQPLRMVGTMTDISQLKEAEDKIRQAQKMEALGMLAGGIAHDFNNILFPIVGMSEMLLEDLPHDSLERENAEEILIAGKRGSDLVKQILTFSRQTDQKTVPVRIQQILKEVLKLSRTTIPADIEIIQNMQVDCGLVLADPIQIHQIAMNLITNAYHAVEETGGSIHVQLKEVQLGLDDIGGSQLEPGRYVRLTVSDSGKGIDPKVMDKIFEPYFTTKGPSKGTGLGLSTAYGIVKDHFGNINVSSEPGKGSQFNIHLPLMEKSVEIESDESPQHSYSGNERILLVDDEAAVARLEHQMLERLGYRVTMRTSSLEALEAFKAGPQNFDLVISDMNMPNMTGDQLARAMIALRTDLPVIICTGFSERLNPDRAADIGIRGYLMKPIVKNEMAKTIRQVLDNAKIRSQGQ